VDSSINNFPTDRNNPTDLIFDFRIKLFTGYKILWCALHYQENFLSVGFSMGESINNRNMPKEDCFNPLENIFSIIDKHSC